jgi:hypothetical protein
MGCILSQMHFETCPSPTSVTQLEALTTLRDIFESWRLLPPPNPMSYRGPTASRPRVDMQVTPRTRPAWTPPPPAPSLLHPRHQERPPITPRQLTFPTTILPRMDTEVVSPPRVAEQPPPRVGFAPIMAPAPVLPPRQPIAHRTRAHAPAPLALFTGQAPTFAGRIPTPKSSVTKSSSGVGFAGLCKAHSMTPPEITNFALLCSALSVLDTALGEFLEHQQLRRDPRYKPIWDTSYANDSAKASVKVPSTTPNGLQEPTHFSSLTTTIFQSTNRKKSVIACRLRGPT